LVTTSVSTKLINNNRKLTKRLSGTENTPQLACAANTDQQNCVCFRFVASKCQYMAAGHSKNINKLELEK
jgi:hypothetical protein